MKLGYNFLLTKASLQKQVVKIKVGNQAYSHKDIRNVKTFSNSIFTTGCVRNRKLFLPDVKRGWDTRNFSVGRDFSFAMKLLEKRRDQEIFAAARWTSHKH